MIRTDYEKNLGLYVKKPDLTKLAAIKKACGIALRGLDAQYVSMTDPVEVKRIADGFASKHLGLAAAATTKALASVEKTMKAERTKLRTTVYYLLAKETGTLGKLGGTAKKAVKAKAAKKVKKAAKKAKPAKKAKKAVKTKAKKAKRK